MSNHTASLGSIFEEFQKIPKGVLIDRPDELVQTDFLIGDSAEHILLVKDVKVFFTRRSLKHVAEKVTGKKLLKAIPIILEEYDSVHLGSKENRLLFSKWILADVNIKPHVVSIEVINPGTFVIVTVFIAKQKYLKNFKILWRTAYPPSAYSR